MEIDKVLFRIDNLICDNISVVSNKEVRDIANKCSSLFLEKYRN